jgi:hypothetical protein
MSLQARAKPKPRNKNQHTTIMKPKSTTLLSGALSAFAVITVFPTQAQATWPKVCYGASGNTASAYGGATNTRTLIFNRHENVTRGVHTRSCVVVSPNKYDGLYIWNVDDNSWGAGGVLNACKTASVAQYWRNWCANANGDIRVMFAGGSSPAGDGGSGVSDIGGWYAAVRRQYLDGRVVTHEMGHTEYANHSDGYCGSQHSDYMQAGGYYCNGGRDLRDYWAGPNFYQRYGLANDSSHNAAGVILNHRFEVESRKP